MRLFSFLSAIAIMDGLFHGSSAVSGSFVAALWAKKGCTGTFDYRETL